MNTQHSNSLANQLVPSALNEFVPANREILKHQWYQKWECGELSAESLKHYAGEYYWQVAHFPRYLSAIHSKLASLSHRQIILRNLADEENAKAPHPELWLDFAEAMGADREAIKNGQPSEAAKELTGTFWSLVNKSAASGLGALMAYESQVPDVAKFKSKALEKHYFSKEQYEKGAKFFDVHAEADVWHTQELRDLIASLPVADQEEARASAGVAAQALWKFLDAMPN